MISIYDGQDPPDHRQVLYTISVTQTTTTTMVIGKQSHQLLQPVVDTLTPANNKILEMTISWLIKMVSVFAKYC